jgi:hypothetical protein
VACCAAAAEPTVKASVQPSTVAAGTPFLLSIEISGNSISQPQIPDLDGALIEKAPSQSFSSMQAEFSGTRRSVVQTQHLGYQAVADRPGKVTIPPISITVDGKVLSTQPLVVTVVASGQPVPLAQPQPPTGPIQPPSTRPSQQGRQPTWDDAVFIEGSVDKNEVYQGQPVQLTLNLWYIAIPDFQVGSARGQDPQFPATEGFYAVTAQPIRVQQQRNGLNYEGIQYRRILYPTAAGDLRIAAWHWEGIAQHGFFDRHKYTLDTQPIDIKVKPLPERPADFSGAVGTFTIKAQLARKQVVQGVPTQLVVQVAGQGNPDAIGMPQMAKIDNAYVSDPEKESKPADPNVPNNVEKTFTYAITPNAAGKMQIPEIAFCYFDPDTASFKTEKTPPFTVDVLPSTETASGVMIGGAVPENKGKVAVIGEDIRPIIESAPRLRPARHGTARTVLFGFTPPLAYGGVALFMYRRRRFETDTGFARDHTAKSRVRKRLKNVVTAAEPSEELYKALVGFIADKFNVAEAGMTSSDTRQLLEARGIEGEQTETVTRILRACERARYASVRLTSDEIDALTQAALAAMDHLEHALKRERRK